MDHAQERHSYPGNPLQQIAKRLRRAARNGTAFHLPPELVPALLASDAMPIILDLETREIRAGLKCPKPQIACRDEGSLETSGSGIARIEPNGASPGTIDPRVTDAASARTVAAVRLTHHHSRHTKNSPPLSTDKTDQKHQP